MMELVLGKAFGVLRVLAGMLAAWIRGGFRR